MKHIKTIMNIQRTIKYIFIIIVICCYAGCQNKPCHNLQLVEELLDRDLLDSASNIFNSIDPTSIKSTSDSAYYNLMKTEIMWQKEEKIKKTGPVYDVEAAYRQLEQEMEEKETEI